MEALNRALFKLAFFEPNLTDENNNQVLDHLILDCITAHSPMLECNSLEIVDYIKNTFTIEFDEAEILAGAKRLEKKEAIIIIDSGNKKIGPRFTLLDGKTDANQNKIQKLEEIVFSEWTGYLVNKYRHHITETNSNRLIAILQAFITKMLVLHGKESVATLYPDNPKTQKWLDEVQEDIINDLPKLGSELDFILQIEIPYFFKDDNENRKEYLNNLFNASFLWHLIQIDDTCSEYFKQTVKGQTLMLDNNIIFSLIGLHGNELLIGIHNLLKYANKLDYKLIVSTKTLDEFYESILKNTEKAYESVAFSKNIALAAIDVLESNNFLVSYWKEFTRNGLAIEEFAVEKSHIKNILEGFNIEIIDDFREEIEKSQELIDEESLLRASCPYGSFSQSIIEHDAFHRILIKKFRKGYKYKYSKAKAWFLTHDSKLPVYAHFALQGRKALPFCISTNEWIQINRPFLSRINDSEEFERSFQTLVTQPFLRSVLSSFKVDRIKEKLLMNLNRYKNIGTQLAFDMATDIHFLYTLSKEKSDSSFEQKVEDEIIVKNKLLKEENKEIYVLLDEIEIQNKEKLDNLKSNLEDVKNQLSEKTKNQDQLSSELYELKKSINDINKMNSEKEQESSTYKSKLLTKEQEIKIISSTNLKQKNIINWGVYFVLLSIGSLIIWFFERIIDWQWFVTHNKTIVLKIFMNLIIVIALLNIPLKKHWHIWIVLTIAILIAFLTLAFN